jgi:peptidyl-prolyl cis-trans isomerase A (cyclophilin A)
MKSLPYRLAFGAAAFLLALTLNAQTLIRVHTNQGPLDMRLLDSEAPVTVANFLAYVRGGDYTDVMIHRNAWSGTTPFVIQAGGYEWPASGGITTVPSRGTIVNEFSAQRSNVRGTVAMAKVGGDPNSATSQWFVNMSNNAATLDTQNGGFTVFGRVTTPGMATADKISALQRVNAGGAFSELPVVNYTGGTVQRHHVVLINKVTEYATFQSESDRIFNYLEANFQQYIGQSEPTSTGVYDGYTYRYYAASNAYAGTKNGKVWYLVPAVSSSIGELGTMADWLATAIGAGY